MFWYEEEVKNLEKKKQGLININQTLFYGSSSIRLWKSVEQDFVEHKALNLGFGGSTLAACVWFFDRILSGYQPDKIVVYAGDNDIGDGRLPEEVFIFFLELTNLIEKKFGTIPCFFISLKPSLTRWNLLNNIKYTNSLIENEIIKRNSNWHFVNIFNKMIDSQGQLQRSLLDIDGLHLSQEGYQVWKNSLNEAFEKFVEI